MSKLVATNVLIPQAHKDALKALSRKTRITQSEYLREAVADLLKKYETILAREPFEPVHRQTQRSAGK